MKYKFQRKRTTLKGDPCKLFTLKQIKKWEEDPEISDSPCYQASKESSN